MSQKAQTPVTPGFSVTEAAAWRVYFKENASDAPANRRPGTELVLNQQFLWGGQFFCIPSVYVCDEGLVVDLCRQAAPEALRAFNQKWASLFPMSGGVLDIVSAAQMQAENPLCLSVRSEITVNGEALSMRHSSGFSWTPVGEHPHIPEQESTLAHYGLDPAFCWNIERCAFPWNDTPPAELTALRINLKRGAVETPGPRFCVSSPGETVLFTHPFTGLQHTLTVQEYERGEMDTARMPDGEFVYPRHYCALAYTVFPNLPRESFTVRDTAQGDSARRVRHSTDGTLGSSVGILLRSAPKESVKFGGSEQGEVRCVASSVSFEPVEQVEWFMLFRDTPVPEDITVELL